MEFQLEASQAPTGLLYLAQNHNAYNFGDHYKTESSNHEWDNKYRKFLTATSRGVQYLSSKSISA